MNHLQNKEQYGIKGMFRVIKLDSDLNPIKFGDWQKNIVVSSNTYGRNIIARQMIGDTSYPIGLTKMVLSTDSATPTDADTAIGGTEIESDLQTKAVSTSGEANVITFSAFFTDNELPNDTYYKIGVKMGTRIFTSALLGTEIVKDTGEQYRIDYQITIN